MAGLCRVWLGAGMVTAGVAAAMVAGAGVAFADSPSASDAKGTTSAESTKTTDKQADSAAGEVDAPKQKHADKKPTNDDADADEQQAEEPTAQEPEEKPATGKKSKGSSTAEKPADTAEKPADKPAKPATDQQEPAVKPAPKYQDPEPSKPVAVADPVVEASAVVVPVARTADTTKAPETAAVAFVAPATAQITSSAAASPLSRLLSAIGTVVFNLYGLASRVLGGPPILPPNSSVTVRSSTLRLDCANGYEVPADWYIPDTAEPPTRLIYLQHGFLASGPWYSYTAAALAEQTNSIVVAPTITSNFLACDGCWLGGDRMQQAVADLFEADNTALADSALAAGYTGPIPDRVVLVGHSAGGGLVAGTAGAMVDNGTIDRLAGVVMLDGVGTEGSMAASLDKVPDDIPIYQLAAPKYVWNNFGVGSEALQQARPDQFIGVTLVGGSHVDSMRGGNPLIQFVQQLAAGFSKPQNVAAAQILMVSWINDMFAGCQVDCAYTDPNHDVTIDTPAGKAIAVPLPNSLTKPYLLNLLRAFVPSGSGFSATEPTCGSDPVAAGCPTLTAA